MDLIQYATIQGQRYKINTDFKVAMECDRIANDNEINDIDRGVLITGLLFGEDSPYCQEALDKAEIFLGGGDKSNDKRIIDLQQHWDMIYSAFKGQYDIDLHKVDLHYQEFLMLLKGLKDQVLTDVIEILTYDMSTVTDAKQKRKIREAQKKFAIKDKKEGKVNEGFINLLDKRVKGG